MTRTKWMTAALFAAAGAATLAVALPATARDGQGPGARDGMRGGPQMLFQRLDTDGDGTITRAEAEAAAAIRFAAADTNGDGLLSGDELVAAAEARRVEELQQRTSRMIERADTDGDGMLSMAEMEGARQGPPLDRLFERLDANKDGVITEEEVAELAGKRGPGRPRHGEMDQKRGGNN